MTSKFGLLRDIKNEELELMLSWRNAPSVRANMYTRHEIDWEEHLAWWERISARTDQRYFMYENDFMALGIVGFNQIDTVNQNASWAFYAAPESKKGTGSRMEYLALEHAFNEIELHKLSCEVLAFNEPVIKLHQKFGFHIEGVLREHHKAEEEFVDIYKLGILNKEWSQQRHSMHAKIENFSR
jgi:UDP-4-amino-4,6-dideoxy-N-acetyl-beta-L-altrosamine N-acetyltransferase